MEVTITWDTLLSIVAILGAAIALYTYFAQFVRFMDRLKQNEKDIKEIKEELGILTVGLLACLKGLSEQGCNGPVSQAINEIETHLNEKAHQ